MRMMRLTGRRAVGEVDSVHAWLRLLAGVLTSTIGGVGMWSIAVVLPTLQADFGVTRADVLLAYTAVMLGAVVGGPVMGWLSDRFGITVSVAIGTAMLALGLALLARELTDSLGKVNAAVDRIRRLKQGLSVLAGASKDDEHGLAAQAKAVAEKLTGIEAVLVDVHRESDRDVLRNPAGLNDTLLALISTVSVSDSAPTKSAAAVSREIMARADAEIGKLERLAATEVTAVNRLAFERALEAARSG